MRNTHTKCFNNIFNKEEAISYQDASAAKKKKIRKKLVCRFLIFRIELSRPTKMKEEKIVELDKRQPAAPRQVCVVSLSLFWLRVPCTAKKVTHRQPRAYKETS